MILEDEEATRKAGACVAAVLQPGDIVTLEGPLGAGKTSFARGLLEALGHDGEVPSPSFAIVQPYEHIDPPVFHVDLYRLEHGDELIELGLDELGNAVLLIEWPDKAGNWDGALRLTITPIEDGTARCLTASAPPAWKERCPFQ